MDVNMAQLSNPHPGEILKEEFLNPVGMSQNQLAHAMGVPGNRIHAIVNGTRAITGDTDLRLCKFFGLSEGYFLRLQNAYDTLEAKRRIAAQVFIVFALRPDGRSAILFELAGGLGFEPRLTESESAVLPLNYPPMARTSTAGRPRHSS